MAKLKRKRRIRAERRPNIPFPGRKPRLYLDADLPSGLVGILAEKGIDSTHPERRGTQSRDDSYHWAEARRLRRVLVSCNRKDFWSDLKYPIKDSPGVIIVDTGGKQDWERVAILLGAFSAHLKDLFRSFPGPGQLWATKVRLTGDRIVWKRLTADSKVETDVEWWGPFWS